jgi:dihydrodipicolinate synthase/N-acetylneuraminate lyase
MPVERINLHDFSLAANSRISALFFACGNRLSMLLVAFGNGDTSQAPALLHANAPVAPITNPTTKPVTT